MSQLPLPRPDQTYVRITPLVAGTLTLPEYAFVSPVDRTAKKLVPSMCFLVNHPGSAGTQPTRFMFDLGLRGAAEDYIPEIQAHLPNRHPVTHRPSAPQTLAAHGVEPASIKAVMLSHVHWDHHGDPTAFPNAAFYVGHGSLDVVANGMPGRGSHSHFDANLFRGVSNVVELQPPAPGRPALQASPKELGAWGGGEAAPIWQPLGPFAAAADLFRDGSVYAIPAPGHLPGHVNLLCRVSEKKWVYLGGDVFHDKRLLTGEKDISTWEEGGHCYCVHIDKEEALRSIKRIAALDEISKAEGQELEVIVAHDSGWYYENKARCMNQIPE